MALVSRQAKEWLGQKHILGFISHRVISGGCQPRPLVGKCPLFGFFFQRLIRVGQEQLMVAWMMMISSIVSFSDGAVDIGTEWS